jgi:hypothetical protein
MNPERLKQGVYNLCPVKGNRSVGQRINLLCSLSLPFVPFVVQYLNTTY